MKVSFSSEDQIHFVDLPPAEYKNVFEVDTETVHRWQRIEREVYEMQAEIAQITNGVPIMPTDGLDY